ncbi:MAG: tetratricopeptide repeat protein [Pyrinomonadaceae bacterium]
MRTVWIFIFLLTITASAQTARNAFEKGTQAAAAGNYPEALKQYQKALEQNNPSADFLAKTHYNIGVCFYHLNQPAVAIEEYAKAIELSGVNYQKPFRARAMAYVELKNWQAAKKSFGEALSLNQHDGESWFDLAMVSVAEKDYDSAADAFRQAIINNSVDLPASHNNLGVISALKGDFPSAEKEFEQSLLESRGSFALAESNLAFCRTQRENRKLDLLAKFEFSVKN